MECIEDFLLLSYMSVLRDGGIGSWACTRHGLLFASMTSVKYGNQTDFKKKLTLPKNDNFYY